MILTLATRNLFHDRIRLIVTLVGILFSIVLVAVQLGLYLGAKRMIVDMIDNAQGELWVTTYGAKSFEEGGILLTPRERSAALSAPGVKAVVPILVQFSEWRKPSGGSTNSVLVGTDTEDGGLAPWNIIEGSALDLKLPDAVIVDKSYLTELGISGVGETAQVEKGRVRVRGMTDGIRSFTMAPYVFTTLNRARNLLGLPEELSSFFLVQLEPGANAEAVKADLKTRLTGTEVLTKTEFRDRSLNQWLFETGAGVAMITGAVLGLIVGVVIVAQTLYSSTKDHLNEFATLRALGSSAGYIHKVILSQAALSAILGYVLGMIVALIIVSYSKQTAMPMLMTPGLATFLFAITLGMCAISAIAAIMKVTKIDPAMVFSR
jgi:putative ABC transport system permease protein